MSDSMPFRDNPEVRILQLETEIKDLKEKIKSFEEAEKLSNKRLITYIPFVISEISLNKKTNKLMVETHEDSPEVHTPWIFHSADLSKAKRIHVRAKAKWYLYLDPEEVNQ